MLRRSFIAAITCAAVAAGCSRETPAPAVTPHADEAVKTLADAYLAGYFDRNPEEQTVFGVPGSHHDRLTDNSLDALTAWQAKEDAWLEQARAIHASGITSASMRATYAIAREALESSMVARVCRSELWNVSQMTGWPSEFGYLVTIQPVGSADARKEALARWSTLPHYIDTDIANLREGIKLGFTAPKLIVLVMIDQVNTLATSTLADSPFMSPAQRDKDPQFDEAFRALVSKELVPAFMRYRDFLKTEYLGAAREAIAVSANPQGAACYGASVRNHSSLPVLAGQVHDLGLSQIESLTAEMKTIAERSFHTSDVPALMQKLRSEPQYLFRNREDLISYTGAALARAKAAVPAWFNLKPKADVRIEPYPKFREKNAPNEYNPPAEDGSRGGLFYISAYQAETKSRAPAESTAFHETIPGHHMQMSIALERKDIHPIGRYIYNSGYVEGWGLYAERLADEMKLYSGDLDRLGMLSGQAFRAARLVVDSGIHTMGWSRQQAIDYMLAHTAEAKADIESEVDRYIIWPGQATAYMLGMLEIRDARTAAEQALGSKFDIKAFHDKILEDGGVPLTFLSAKIGSWVESVQKQ